MEIVFTARVIFFFSTYSMTGHLHSSSASQSLVCDEMQSVEIVAIWKVSRWSARWILRWKVNCSQLSPLPHDDFVYCARTFQNKNAGNFVFKKNKTNNWTQFCCARQIWETTNLCVFCRRIISGACWILADAIWAVIASVCARRSPNTLKYVTLMV